MRVAFDIHAIGRRETGNETYAHELLRAFVEDPADDIELVLYGTASQRPRADGLRYRRMIPSWPYLRIPVVSPLWLARDRIDVAHFQYLAPPLSPSAIVLTIHDLSFERHPEFFPRSMALRLRALVRHFARRAAQVIAVSNATRDDLLDCYDVDADRVTVVHNGAPAVGAPQDRAKMRAALHRFGLERPFIACVGNIGHRTNQRRLVAAFARLVGERGVGHDLVLAGKPGYGAAAVTDEIAAHGLGSRVHVTGFVTQQELAAIYGLAAFTVYPSLYEGFGLPILESMACGTPVITSSVSCMPEIAGTAAVLVDPLDVDALASAMASLLGNRQLCDDLAARGRERVRQFSWRHAARLTRDVYRRAAGGAAR